MKETLQLPEFQVQFCADELVFDVRIVLKLNKTSVHVIYTSPLYCMLQQLALFLGQQQWQLEMIGTVRQSSSVLEYSGNANAFPRIGSILCATGMPVVCLTEPCILARWILLQSP